MRIAVVDVDTLTRNWWVFLLRGLAGILFGLITLFSPSISLLALVLVFGAYAFVDGVLAIMSAVRRHGEDRWWILLLQGLRAPSINCPGRDHDAVERLGQLGQRLDRLAEAKLHVLLAARTLELVEIRVE